MVCVCISLSSGHVLTKTKSVSVYTDLSKFAGLLLSISYCNYCGDGQLYVFISEPFDQSNMASAVFDLFTHTAGFPQ